MPGGFEELAGFIDRSTSDAYGCGRWQTDDGGRVAGDDLFLGCAGRWRPEECFQQAKNEAGLDQYQVRSWRAWYAHITLSMLALAWLAASRAQAKKGIGTSDPGMIGYTVPEIRRLMISLIQARAPDPEHVWSWSRWRRRRQTRPASATTGARLRADLGRRACGARRTGIVAGMLRSCSSRSRPDLGR